MAKRVLYVEDEAFFARIVSKQLTDAGFEVEIADDGEAAIQAVGKSHFDLVFLDLILPKLSGFDVLKKIKEDTTTKKIPVVILSNLSSESDKKQAQDLGATEFCIKMSTYPQQVAEIAKRIVGATS